MVAVSVSCVGFRLASEIRIRPFREPFVTYNTLGHECSKYATLIGYLLSAKRAGGDFPECSLGEPTRFAYRTMSSKQSYNLDGNRCIDFDSPANCIMQDTSTTAAVAGWSA